MPLEQTLQSKVPGEGFDTKVFTWSGAVFQIATQNENKLILKTL